MPKQPDSYLDIMKPEDITIAYLWTLFAGKVLPADCSKEQREEMRGAFYAGFCECFKVHFDLSTGMSEDQAVAVLDRLNDESKAFFTQMMKAHFPPPFFKAGTGPCGRVGCDKPGVYNPVLILSAGVGTTPASARVGITVCEEHKQKGKPSDFITDESWEMIGKKFASIGKARPIRELTEIDWVTLQ